MKGSRELILHASGIAVSAALALTVWTSEEKPKTSRSADVEVWGGQPEKIQAIAFESDNAKVRLAAKTDSHGRYFVGESTKTVTMKAPLKKADGGASPPKPETKTESSSFISVTAAEKLAEQLAPLKAYGAVGAIEESRAEEFGFDKVEGTIRVTLGGQVRTLTLGGTTPGGADRYVKTDGGKVFAVAGSIARDLMAAESRLVERKLHGFEDADVGSVTLQSSEATRKLVRITGKRDVWASDGSTEKDETAGNWMAKLRRLRATKFVEKPKPPPSTDNMVVRVNYKGKRGQKLGYLELYRTGTDPDNPKQKRYLVKTEYTRWYAQVLGSTGEQVDQDVSAVVQ